MKTARADSSQRTFVSFAGIAVIRSLTVTSQLITFAAASQVFGKDEFGLFAFSYALTRLLHSGSCLGAPSYLLKDIPYRQVHGRPWHSIRSAMLYFLAAPLIICIIVGLIFECLVVFEVSYFPLRPLQGAAIAVLAFLWAILSTLAAYVRTLRSSSEAMLISELSVPAALLVTMGLGWLNGHSSVTLLLIGASIILLVGELFMFGWHAWKVWMPVGGANSESISFEEIRAYWGTVLLNTLSSQLDVVVAGFILSPAVVGLYAIVKRVSSLTTLAVSVVVWMYAPKISRASAASNIAALTLFARRSIQFSLGSAIIFFALVIVALPWWTAYFEISVDRTFWIVLALMLGCQMLSVSMGITMTFATQTGQPLLIIRSLTRAIAIVVPFMLITGLALGIIGVAAAQLVMVILMKWPVCRALKQQGLDISLTALLKKTSKNSQRG